MCDPKTSTTSTTSSTTSTSFTTTTTMPPFPQPNSANGISIGFNVVFAFILLAMFSTYFWRKFKKLQRNRATEEIEMPIVRRGQSNESNVSLSQANENTALLNPMVDVSLDVENQAIPSTSSERNWFKKIWCR
jgi:hypothetical protein